MVGFQMIVFWLCWFVYTTIQMFEVSKMYVCIYFHSAEHKKSAFIMRQKSSVSNKYCCFELSVHQK